MLDRLLLFKPDCTKDNDRITRWDIVYLLSTFICLFVCCFISYPWLELEFQNRPIRLFSIWNFPFIRTSLLFSHCLNVKLHNYEKKMKMFVNIWELDRGLVMNGAIYSEIRSSYSFYDILSLFYFFSFTFVARKSRLELRRNFRFYDTDYCKYSRILW